VEELVAIILQIIFEIGLQVLGSLSLDFSLGKSKTAQRIESGCAWIFVHGLFGGGLGWLSTKIAPQLLLPNPGLRFANLLVAPAIAGGVSYLIAKVAKNRGYSWNPLEHFWHGFTFALFFGSARFAFGIK
jgi:hypothetical protein